MTLPRDLTTANEVHITALIDAQASEGTYLDFKRELPARDARGTNDLVADVSAFANSSGGDLVYGIDEDGEGQAAAVVPQQGNMDEEARRIQDVLMNNIEPRVPGIQVQSIAVVGGFVLVIRVPQSWAGPHRVKSNFQFYIREGGAQTSPGRSGSAGPFLAVGPTSKTCSRFSN